MTDDIIDEPITYAHEEDEEEVDDELVPEDVALPGETPEEDDPINGMIEEAGA